MANVERQLVQNRESDPEESIAGLQLRTFHGRLVDGSLLSHRQIIGGQAEPGYQERSDQKINRLDDAQEEVSQSCRDTAILLPRSQGIKSNSLTGHKYGVIGMNKDRVGGRALPARGRRKRRPFRPAESRT